MLLINDANTIVRPLALTVTYNTFDCNRTSSLERNLLNNPRTTDTINSAITSSYDEVQIVDVLVECSNHNIITHIIYQKKRINAYINTR
jgi:hypothetical protein